MARPGFAVVGGDFSRYGPERLTGVSLYSLYSDARFTDSYTQIAPGPGDSVNALLVPSPEGIIAGGDFSLAQGDQANFIARYSFSSRTWSSLGAGVDGPVFGLASLGSQEIVAMGGFALAGNTSAANIAAFNLATSTWRALGAGLNGEALAGVVRRSGELVVTGRFSVAGDVPAQQIAQFDPITNTWTSLVAGLDGPGLAALILPDGDLIVGGAFSHVGTVAARNIARYSFAAETWSNLADGHDGEVRSLGINASGDLVAVGDFRSPDGKNAVARFSLASQAWYPISNGVPGSVSALLTLSTGTIITGGTRTDLAGQSQATFADFSDGTPYVVIEPALVEICPGHNFTLRASASSTRATHVTFQWRKSGVPLDPVSFPGSNTVELTISNAGDHAGGLYDCVVLTDCGSTISEPAEVIVLDPDSAPCQAIACDPDYNQDGNADIHDVECLLNIIGSGDNPTGRDPDFNQDGNADQGDIDALSTPSPAAGARTKAMCAHVLRCASTSPNRQRGSR